MVKSMLHKQKRDSGIERGFSKLGETAVLSFVCAQVVHKPIKALYYTAWATKPFGRVHESVSGHQSGKPKVLHRTLD